MDDNELHEWFIQSFGPYQGEMAYNQFQELPEEIKDQILAQGIQGLPDPAQVQNFAKALGAGGLNTMDEMRETLQAGAINAKMAISLAQSAVQDSDAQPTVSASDGDLARQAVREANLWLDSATSMDPVVAPALLTRSQWVEQTLPAWCRFAGPVAKSTSQALAELMSQRLGGDIDGEIAGMYAGPVKLPIPDDLKDPKMLMSLMGNTAFGMQMGMSAGQMAGEVRGSFDQGVQLLDQPGGALIVQNCIAYAHKLEIDVHEVLDFLALREMAYARLFAHVPWLMPRFEALIGKYARGIEIDLDAMREQLEDVQSMDPEHLTGAVSIMNVASHKTPEQREALAALETLLALVEGWVDVVVWRAAMAYLPHLDQLREMMRRERATGGPAEQTFESLIGLEMRPKRSREAAALWETITSRDGVEARDAHWNHPDLLPVLPDIDNTAARTSGSDTTHPHVPDATDALHATDTDEGDVIRDDAEVGDTPHTASLGIHADNDAQYADVSDSGLSLSDSTTSTDWDSELHKLLDEEQRKHGESTADGSDIGNSSAGNTSSDYTSNPTDTSATDDSTHAGDSADSDHSDNDSDNDSTEA